MSIYEQLYRTYKTAKFKANQICYIDRFGKCEKPQFDVKTGEWIVGNRDKNSPYMIKSGAIDEIMGYYADVQMLYHFKELSYSSDVICAHSFGDVIYAAYTYPASFRIPKQYFNDYSKQELTFLMKLIRKCREDSK